jgi:hypothetical protein
VESLDLISVMKEFGVAVGFAVYLIIQSRIDRADALRREAAYTSRLEVFTERLLTAMEENADANRGLHDQIHEFKNMIQKNIFDTNSRAQARQGSD